MSSWWRWVADRVIPASTLRLEYRRERYPRHGVRVLGEHHRRKNEGRCPNCGRWACKSRDGMTGWPCEFRPYDLDILHPPHLRSRRERPS